MGEKMRGNGGHFLSSLHSLMVNVQTQQAPNPKAQPPRDVPPVEDIKTAGLKAADQAKLFHYTLYAALVNVHARPDSSAVI